MRSIRKNARRVAAATVASGVLAAGALALTTSAASASTSQPSVLTSIGGVAHGEAGAHRPQAHGPPAKPGTIP